MARARPKRMAGVVLAFSFIGKEAVLGSIVGYCSNVLHIASKKRDDYLKVEREEYEEGMYETV